MPLEPQYEPQHRIGGQESSDRTWRVLGLVGVTIALAVAFVQSFPLESRQFRQFLFAGLILVVTLIVLRILFRPAWKTFISTSDLLVPIGVVVMASTIVNLLVTLPPLSALLMPSWSPSLFGLSLSLSVGTVLQILVWTTFAAWQTDLLWRSVQGDDSLVLAPWTPIRRYFLRAFVALAIGMGVLLAIVVPAVALSSAAIVAGFLAMGIIGVVWNLLTAALLPVVMLSPSPVLAAIREGFERSWTLKGRWWKQLMAHLVLLGLIIVLRTHFTTTDETTDPARRVTNVNQQSKTNVKMQLNAFWAGGYENQCRWYSKYAEALEAEQVPIITKVLGILFLVVAAAMKWTVLRGLTHSASELTDLSSSSASTLPV